MLSKKYYEKIARIFLKAKERGDGKQHHTMILSIIDDLVDYFEEDNGNFDRSRFLKSCGVIE